MSDDQGCGATVAGAIAILAIIAALMFFPGRWADQNKAVRLLQDQGFTKILVVDRDIWWIDFKGGSGDDSALFTITATNPAGKTVTVHVFVGWPWKGATLRGY